VESLADARVDIEAHERVGPFEGVCVEAVVERVVSGRKPTNEGVGEGRERAVSEGGADDIAAVGRIGWGVSTGFHDLRGGT